MKKIRDNLLGKTRDERESCFPQPPSDRVRSEERI